MYLPCHHQAGWGNSRRRPFGRFDLDCFQLLYVLLLGLDVFNVVLTGTVLGLDQFFDEPAQRALHDVDDFLIHLEVSFLDCGCFAQIQQTIEITKIAKTVLILAMAPLLLTACGTDAGSQTVLPKPEMATSQPEYPEVKEMPAQNVWADEKLEAMVLTLAGECYDDKEHDKRLVCEVILNRVSDGRFGDSVLEVVSAPNQFSGYWEQSREITENDYDVATEALEDWYESGCEALSDYLFFVAGDNRENVFRCEY